MFLQINRVDLSAKTNKYGYVQTPRKIQGPNAGTDGLGNAIDDIIGVVYDLAVPIAPGTAADVAIWAAIAAQEIVTVTYYSAAHADNITVQMRPSLSSIPLALKDSNKEIYYGQALTLEAIYE